MTSNNATRPVITAAPGTPCGWTHRDSDTGRMSTCESGRPAAHILTVTLPVAEAGTALCGLHSPFDATEAERAAIVADADKTWADKAQAPQWGDAAKVGGTWSASGRIVDTEAVDPEACKKHKGGYNIPGVAVCIGCEADGTQAMEGPTGIEVLAEMLTLDIAPAPVDVVKFHKLSAPMIGVLAVVVRSRGLVGAWVMRNVVLTQVAGANRRTVDALIRRGLLAEAINDNDASGTGGLTDYVLTEAGTDVCAALGMPVPELPTTEESATAYVAGFTSADCERPMVGCEWITARGVALLSAGGDVCVGCGSIFTRPTGWSHPGLDLVSAAVVVRNQAAAPLAPVDREAEAYAAWVADKATDPNVEIIDGHPYGRASKLPIFRNVAPGGMGIIARHKAAEAARKAAECEACHDAPGDRSLTLTGTFAGSSGPRTPGEQIRLCTPCYRVVLEQTGDRGSGTVAVYWHAVRTPGQVIGYNDPTTVRYLFVERLAGPFDAYDRAREVASVCEPNYSPTITLCGFNNPNHQRAYLVTRGGVDRVEYMTPATAWGLAWEVRHLGRDLTFACAEVDPVTGEVVARLWNNDGTKGDAK